MDKDTNMIIAGKYQGSKVSWNDSFAYIVPLDDAGKRTITSENVSSVVKVSETDGDVVRGAFWGGVTGALIAKDIGGFIMTEIQWNDGQKSLVKAAKGAYDIILASSYKSNASYVSRKAFEKKESLERLAKAQKQFEDDKKKRIIKWYNLSEQERKMIIDRERKNVIKGKGNEATKDKFPTFIVVIILFDLVLGITILAAGLALGSLLGVIFGGIAGGVGIIGLIAILVTYLSEMKKAKDTVDDAAVVDWIHLYGVDEINEK